MNLVSYKVRKLVIVEKILSLSFLYDLYEYYMWNWIGDFSFVKLFKYNKFEV